MLKVAIVILNWNGRKYLEKFLPSVVNYSDPDISGIFVADNSSEDDSLEFLSENYPDIKQILLKKNYGFAEGYNRALDQIEADYFLLLNSDIEVTENWLHAMIEVMDSSPLIAGVSPKILAYDSKEFFEHAGAGGGFIDKYGYAFCRGRIFDTVENDYGQYNKSIDVFWTTGACMMVRSGLFKLTGGFDADFFAHFEEIDYCWRLKNRGYRFVFTANSHVFHVGGGTLHSSNPWKTYLNYRNNLSCMYKNLPPDILSKTVFIRLVLDGISSLRFLWKFKFGDFFAVIKAHFHFYSAIPRLRKFRASELQFVNRKFHKEMYPGNLVKEYFISKKISFSALKWSPERN
ncbi:MAG: glycosyltransferase family 2 protein [Bacteroidales bacterium]|nr:glycosyltransferase family 2 protein [Bacteroidales bacterium]MCF8391924.1 glycosyltransferase family 2 protein [Bacteroidales bacterium]